MTGVNVNRIQSCHAAHDARWWARPIDRGDRADRPRYGDDRCDVQTSCGGDRPYDAYCPSNIESPVQPPWRVLPWPTACGPVTRRAAVAVAAVKAPLGLADVSSVGRTLDLFV